MICQRCTRREANVTLTVEAVTMRQCSPCARVGVQLAATFGFTWEVERYVHN